MKKKKYRGIEQLKSRYGWLFISTWLVGVILFFAIPVIQSVIYSFSQMTVNEGGIKTLFVGMKNYKYIIAEHTDYLGWLRKSVTNFLYSLPIIVLLSLVLALLLNNKFKGRLFFRALYFMPVIIASGVVIELISGMTTGGMSDSSVSESVSGGMFSVQDVMAVLDLPNQVAEYVQKIISNIFDLIWNSGIQTVLFIAGLQSIPSSLYEASRVEGATKWEELWYITVPMLRHSMILVAVFTTIDFCASSENKAMKQAFTLLLEQQNYNESSAMMWAFFMLIGIVFALILFFVQHFIFRRWE